MSLAEKETKDILGRDDVNDIEAILNITNTDVDEVIHAVRDDSDALFTWDYSLARPNLRRLYEKAKTGQWGTDGNGPSQAGKRRVENGA